MKLNDIKEPVIKNSFMFFLDFRIFENKSSLKSSPPSIKHDICEHQINIDHRIANVLYPIFSDL